MGIKREDGSALLLVLVVSMLVLAFAVAFHKWTTQGMAQAVHRNGTEVAVQCAQSATQMAQDVLRDPTRWAAIFPTGVTSGIVPLAGSAPPDIPCPPASISGAPVSPKRGWAETTATLDASDGSLVDLNTTAYYDLRDGPQTDPKSSLPAIRAIIDTKVRLRSIGSFFAAVPTTLEIAYGTDLSAPSAMVYARDLIFQPGGGNSPTVVNRAYYSDRLQFSPGAVQFLNPPTRLSSEPNLTYVDTTTASFFLNWAGPASANRLSGTVTSLSPPANVNGTYYGVYYADNDLSLGSYGGTLDVPAPIVIFCAGRVTLNSSIVPDGGWLAVVAQGDIILSQNMPKSAVLNGTFITSGQFYAQPLGGTDLTFNGGFEAGGGASLQPGWATRKYSYQAPPANMMLPYYLSVEQYHIVEGKYSL